MRVVSRQKDMAGSMVLHFAYAVGRRTSVLGQVGKCAGSGQALQ